MKRIIKPGRIVGKLYMLQKRKGKPVVKFKLSPTSTKELLLVLQFRNAEERYEEKKRSYAHSDG